MVKTLARRIKNVRVSLYLVQKTGITVRGTYVSFDGDRKSLGKGIHYQTTGCVAMQLRTSGVLRSVVRQIYHSRRAQA